MLGAPALGVGIIMRLSARWLLSLALISWLAVHTNWHAVWLTFQAAHLRWLFVAAGLYLMSQFASVVRWSLIVSAAGLDHSRRKLLSAYFEGMFVNVCLPTTLGGDVLKIFRIGGSQHKQVVASTVMVDRLSGLAALVILLTLGLILGFDDHHGTHLAPLLGLSALIGVLTSTRLLRAIAAKRNRMNTAGRISALRRLGKWPHRLVSNLRQQATDTPWHYVFLWALVVQSLNVIAVAAAAHAIGLSVPMTPLLIATTTVSLATAMPISVSGIGVREASLPLLLAADGVPRELAFTLGLVWSIIVVAVGLIGGPIHLLRQRSSVHDSQPLNSVDVCRPQRTA